MTRSGATRSVEIVFDLEANGYRDEADKVWCICIKELGFIAPVEEYHSDGLYRGLERLDEADVLIGHNIIDYDLPVLEKIYGWKPKPHVKIIDTVVKSRLLRSDRALPHGCPGNIAPHSLAAWGYRLGRGKPDHDDWTRFSPEMLHRCSEDVEINALTHDALIREEQALALVDWSDSMETEHGIAPLITAQELRGVPLDIPLVWSTRTKLRDVLRKIDEEVVPLIPEVALPKSKQGTWPKQQYKKDGTPTVNALRYYGPDFGKDKEYRTDKIVRTAPINLRSDKQVKDYLLSIGWVPTEWNYKKGKDGKPIRDEYGQRIKTSPRLTLESLESCTWPDEHAEMGEKICERLCAAHRFSMLNGWIRDMRPDGRISAEAIPMGTPTGRMTHRKLVNVPGNGAPWGKELRSCCTVEDDRVRVGIDLRSCQVYGLAHYLEDEGFRYEVTEGDYHQYACDLAGLADRQAGKKFNYSILFGASDEKLAQDLGITVAQAAAARAAYFGALPSLDLLLKRLEKQWKKYGYIIGLDGRAVWVRAKHMLLVYLLQTLESVVIKNFIVMLDRMCKEGGVDAYLITTMHDECQWSVRPEHVDLFKQFAEVCINNVNQKFNLWCPQAIDVNVGKSWSECH